MRVFHITYADRLPSIAEHGLDPSAHGPFSTGAYAAHSRGRNFFTHGWDGVSFWMSRYEDFANNDSDTPIEDGLVPVVLAMDVDEDDLSVDDVSRNESIREDFFATKPIAPDEIEVFYDGEWYDLQEAVEADLIDPSEAGEEDGDDGETWFTFKAESPFMPTNDDELENPDVIKRNPPVAVTKTQASAAWVQLGRPRVDLEQLRMGMEVEQEHTDDILEAAKVAIDHLDEFEDYYDRLAVMEERARRHLPPNGLRPNGSSAHDEFNTLVLVLRRMYPDFGTLVFVEDDAAHDGGRHYAYCGKTKDGAEIAFASAADDHLSPDQMRAMMAHEIGHAIDFRYGRRVLERQFGNALASDGELRADQIAETVFGFPINYDAKCAYVQTAAPGVYPRPRGLR